MKKIRKGFTLVEVICVLTIIAIIAAIAVPNISGYIEKSKINNCRSIMTDFVNDLEYKIVSKRYYDINELNDALENCIKEAGGERKSDSKINGICPNGGEYALSWTITPGKPDENSKIYTAKVEVSNCVCECLGTDENAVVHTGHEFTAALVSSEYFDDGKTIEDKYNEIIEGIIDDVENSKKSTGDLDGIVDEVDTKNPEYIIAGVTTTLDKKVEWISVYYHDTFSTKENKYKFLTKSKGKLIVKDLTETQFNDKSNWPPAEGTCGSAVFKEGWNKDINYFVGGINYADTNNVKIGWIQRDGSWYVQSNSEVDGINIDVSSKETNDFQHIISENKVDTSKGLSVSARQPIVAETNFANSFSVSPSYTGTEDKPGFGHIEYSSESKYIKNGYIITDVSVIDSNGNWPTWAGVFCGTDLTDRTNLEKILKQEGTLISEFQNGYKDSLVIAYQEYYKSYDEAGKTYTYTPFTVYEVIDKTDESTFKGTDIKYTKSDTEKFEIDNLKVFVNEDVKVKLPTGKVEDLACIKRREVYHITDSSKEGYFFVPSGQTIDVYPEGGDQSIIDKLNSGAYSADIWYQNPSNGTIHKVGTASTTKKGITLDYKAGTDDSSFEIGKLEITGEFELKIQKNGSTDYLPDTGVVKTDVKHIKSKDNENGFYISDSNNTDENEIIKKINSSVGSGNIYYYDSESKTSEIIGSLSSDFSLSADYDNAVDKVFRLEGLTVNANYTISVNDSTMTIASVKHSEKLKHFSDNGGYLISTNPDHAGKITELNDSDTLNALKSAYKGDIYIDYTDVEIRSTKVTVDTRAVITAPDYVFYTLSESESTRYVYVDKYIGSSETMNVPREISGYWQMNEKPDNSNPFVEVSYGKDTLYYIDDGKMSVIKQIGKTDVLPLQIDYSKKILYNNNRVKRVTLENCDADTITSYAFLNGGNIEYLNIGTKVKIIGEGAFQNCNNLKQTNKFVIPDSVISIGKNAFSNFGLLDGKGEMVINGCSELRELNTNSVNQSVNAVRAAVIDGKNCEAVLTKDTFGDNIKLNVNKLSIGGIVEKIDDNAFQNFRFALKDNKSYLIIGGNVETIGASAFQNSNFTDLIIGDNVNNIEAYAFYDCQSYNGTLDLKKVVNIGQYAFGNCKNATGGLVIPETVESIGQFAFDSFASSHNVDNNNNTDSKVGELVIKGGSSNQGHTLGGFIFTNANFKNVKIEGKITEISAYAFKNSPINGSTPYNDIKGSLEISGSVKTIGKSAFENCNGFTGDLILPEGLTVINDATFNGCLGFTGNLNIPSTVTQIGSRAFMGCVGMNGSLTLSNNLKKIGMEAFKDCINFKNGLKIPETVTEGIGNCAFQRFAKNTSEQGLLEINAGSYSNGTKLGGFIFTEAKFNGITVGGIVQEISANAFHHDQSDDIDLNYTDPDDPDNNSSASSGGETTTEGSLSKTTLKADYSGITGSLVVETSVTKIDDCAFYNCEGLNAVSFNAKKQSNSNSYTYSDTEGLEYIGEGAFRGCVNVGGNLIIPKTVTLIETCAFKMFGNGSGSLVIHGGSFENKLGYVPEGKTYFPIFPSSKFNGVTIGGNVTEICDGFMNNNLNSFLNHTEGSEEYRTYDYNDIKGGLCIESSVEKIGGYAFQECKFDGDIEFKLPADSKTRTVGKECFKGCSDITGNLDLSRVTEIGDSAFYGCSKIQSVNLYDGLTRIGDDAFNRCSGAGNDLYIPRTVTYIGRCAFKYYGNGNGNLKVYGGSEGTVLGNKSRNTQEAVDPIFPSASFKSVTIGGNVTKIYDNLFNNVSNHYETGTTNVNDTYNYDNLKGSLTIENSVTLIGERAFLGCNFYGDLKIEEKGDSDKEGLKTIKKEAFAKVGFNNVNIPATVTEIGDMAFWDSGNGNGKLVIDGCTDTAGNLGYTNRKSNIFVGAKYNGVKIGGSVKNISDNFMHNMLNSSVNGSKFTYDGVEYWYDYTHITGGLSLSNSIETIGVSAFESCAFTGRLILGENTDSRSASEPKLREIGNYAFKNCENMSGTLVIPYTMKSMGGDAFYHFAAKAKPEDAGALIIWGGSSNNGSSIDHEIFIGSQFKDVFISGTVNRIEDRAFINENNDKNRLYDKWSGTLAIGRGVTYIGNEAFKNCPFDGLLNLRDDSYVSSQQSTSEPRPLTIGANAFAGCTKFYDNFTPENGGQAEFIVPESVVSIGEHAFSGMCSSTRETSKIPALKIYGSSNPTDQAFGSVSPLVNGKYPTIQIFDNAQFKNVTIGRNVSCLAEEAFKNDNGIYSKLTGNLTIESTVDSVWRQAFYNCSGFDGVLTLGLDYNSETGVLNDGVENIGDEAFSGCVKFSQGLRIPPSVKNIGQNAFNSFASNTQSPGFLKIEGSSGTKTVGNTEYQMIGKNIFNNSKFKDIIIGWNTRLIEENFISNNSLITGNVNIGANVAVIEESAFENCSGLDGELYFKTEGNNGIRNIGENAFKGCSNFYKNYTKSDNSQAVFTIPETVTEIKSNAFESMCSGITDMDRIPKLEILGASLTTTDSNGNITEKAFGSTGPWNANTQKYDTITIFKNAKFNNVYIGGNVQTIAERAFDNSDEYYNGITGDIEINVKNIWEKAFYKMESVDENYRGKLILDEGVENIGAYAFAETRFFGNVAIEERSFVIPGSVKSIDSCAFQYFCSGFRNPPSLTVRGYASAGVEGKGNGYGESARNIFEYSSFRNVTFEGNVKVIGKNAFNNSDGRYNGWTGVYTFNAGGLERLYDGCFNGHNFSNVNLAKSIKRNGGIDLVSWAPWDKSGVFGTDKNVSTF